jgi:hypothetical protein
VFAAASLHHLGQCEQTNGPCTEKEQNENALTSQHNNGAHEETALQYDDHVYFSEKLRFITECYS